MSNNPWTTLSERSIYQNPWIRLSHREVITPGGKPGIYGVVQFQNLAIGVVPIDAENHTWLVGQYRYALDRYSWEIPEGGCPIGTDPLAAASRELAEETGITAQQWTKIANFDLSNSVTDETGMVFIARELSFGDPSPEDTEEITVKRLPFSEAVDMVLQGEITDALSIIGLLRARVWLDSGE